MSPERTWPRSLAALTAWCLMTSVGIAASWWGLSEVLTSESRGYEESAVVVTSDKPSETTSDTESPQSRSPSDEPEPSQEAPEPEAQQSEAPPDGWTSLGDNTFERTFDTKGGIAVIQVSPGNADLISASPAEGYQAETADAGPAGYVVTFYGISGAIVVEAGWRDGEPYGEVTTRP